MGSTGWALLVKLGFTFIAGLLTLALFDGNTWLAVLVWAAAVTAANYLIDDRYILPTVGNPIAAVVDGVLAAGLAWLLGVAFPWFRTTGATLVALAAVIAIMEYFFHVFLKESRTVLP